MQLILVGDYCQLPPVERGRSRDQKSSLDDKRLEFCFELPLWRELNLQVVELNQVFRQKDKELVDCLNRIRFAEHTKADISLLYKRVGKELDTTDGILPTKLFSHNLSVDSANKEHLQKLKGDEQVFTFRCNWEFEKGVTGTESINKLFQGMEAKLIKDCQAENEIRLKVGAQVILLANLSFENGLVNGSRGVVQDFVDVNYPLDKFDVSRPVVKFANGQIMEISPNKWHITEQGVGSVCYWQIPLKLAYALSIHKCVAEGTLVHTTKKGLIPIEEFHHLITFKRKDSALPIHESVTSIQRINCPSRDIIASATQVYKGHFEQGIEISTQLGFRIRGSSRHPILVREEGDQSPHEWKQLPDIQLGDQIPLKIGLRTENKGPSSILTPSFARGTRGFKREDFAYYLGLLVGGRKDVGPKSELVIYSSANPLLLEWFSKLTLALFSIHVCSAGKPASYFIDKVTANYLYYYGLQGRGHVPWCITNSSLSCQKEFLSGLFDHSAKVGEILQNHISIELGPLEDRLADRVQVLLANLGIVSFNSERDGDNCRIIVSDHFAYKLVKEIPSRCGLYDGVDWTRWSEFSFSPSKELTKNELASIKVCYEEGLVYDRVVSKRVTYCQMYDLFVEDTNNFITDCMISHNSQGLSLDKAEISLKGIFDNGQAYVALSRIRSLNSMTLDKFSPAIIKAHPKVVYFYKNGYKPYQEIFPDLQVPVERIQLPKEPLAGKKRAGREQQYPLPPEEKTDDYQSNRKKSRSEETPRSNLGYSVFPELKLIDDYKKETPVQTADASIFTREKPKPCVAMIGNFLGFYPAKEYRKSTEKIMTMDNFLKKKPIPEKPEKTLNILDYIDK